MKLLASNIYQHFSPFIKMTATAQPKPVQLLFFFCLFFFLENQYERNPI